MKSGDTLFEHFENNISNAAPQLFVHERARKTIVDILDMARTLNKTAYLTGYGQVSTAVWRELEGTNVGMPTGRIYALPDYDEFTLESRLDFDGQFTAVDQRTRPENEESITGIEYISRLLIITADKHENPKDLSGLKKRIWSLIEEPVIPSKNIGIFQLVLPKEAAAVNALSAITFAVTMAASGQSYFHTFVPNENFGKIKTEAVLTDNDGIVREQYGDLDKKSLKAIRCNGAQIDFMLAELDKALSFAKNQQAVQEKKEKLKLKLKRQNPIIEKAAMTIRKIALLDKQKIS